MIACGSVDLVEMARRIVEQLGQDTGTGISALRAALLASQLYEALRVELKTTPSQDPVKLRVLAAAIDRCRHAVGTPISIEAMAAELTAVVKLLESASPHAPRTQRRARFTVINGGLSGSL
jgi:hypothetical protein